VCRKKAVAESSAGCREKKGDAARNAPAGNELLFLFSGRRFLCRLFCRAARPLRFACHNRSSFFEMLIQHSTAVPACQPHIGVREPSIKDARGLGASALTENGRERERMLLALISTCFLLIRPGYFIATAPQRGRRDRAIPKKARCGERPFSSK
jgi:hypothetical protein